MDETGTAATYGPWVTSRVLRLYQFQGALEQVELQLSALESCQCHGAVDSGLFIRLTELQLRLLDAVDDLSNPHRWTFDQLRQPVSN